MASGGTTVIGEEIIFMDLRDTVCQVTEALAQAASSNWISPATSTTGVTVVLYNGELGIYSVVDLNFQFTKRGGQIDTFAKILTAEVPIRTIWWTASEALVALMCLGIVASEAEELFESCCSCRCCSPGGYFRDFWNILDWAVCFLFFGQAVLWFLLEFVWYPDTYALLQLDGCVSQSLMHRPRAGWSNCVQWQHVDITRGVFNVSDTRKMAQMPPSLKMSEFPAISESPAIHILS